MQHRRGAHARAHVGRAAGEIAPLGIEGIYALRPQGVVGGECQFRRTLQLHARQQTLYAQMVFLIEHDRDGLARGDQRRRALWVFEQVVADEMMLHQTPPLVVAEVVDAQKRERAALGAVFHRLMGAGDDLFRRLARQFRGKGKILIVSRQPHTAGNDDVLLGRLHEVSHCPAPPLLCRSAHLRPCPTARAVA